jgi:ligand-binding sensor domain-containing protein
MKKALISILCVLSVFQLHGQIPVGAWRDHLPYNHCKKVVKVGTKIFCATSFNAFTYDSRDNSLQKLSKITGLSDIGISTMDYNAEKDILLIAYDDGNIDLIKNFVVTNISVIQKQIMTGSKKAGNILFRGNFAYLSYPFGIVALDLERLEIKDTYPIGEAGVTYEVFAITTDNQYFYVASSKGIFKADVNDPFLVNYTRWHRDVSIPNNTGKFSLLCSFNGKIIANISGAADNTDTLYCFENNTWRKFLTEQHQQRTEIRQSGGQLLVASLRHLYILNNNLEVTATTDDYGFTYASPKSAMLDGDGNLWIADEQVGLVLKKANTSNYQCFFPNGPNSQNVWNMLYKNGAIYATGGGANGVWNHFYIQGQYYTFKNENWTTISNDKIPDFTGIAIDPTDPGKVYTGTVGNGVLVYENGNTQPVANYTYNNSTLQSLVPNEDYVRIGGLVFDKDNNLWITNCGGNIAAPISVRKPDGTWKSFAWGNYINALVMSQIFIDSYGRFWVALQGNGLFVFDINGTLDNDKDDLKLKFKPKSLYSDVINNVYCITSDRDGFVWVGTDHGPVFYSNPQGVLDGATDGNQVNIPRNDGSGLGDALLRSETINCIAVDGANRKWFGTQKGGAFLFSPDGLKEIHHFNMDNSPIFSNNILTIAIDELSGEVFLGTDKGIISYREKATKPNEDFTNVYTFPNPVRENYHGDIIISGLIENTHIRITDISGNLVFQTKSTGGQAVWNGNTGGGRHVASGVYLVFCSNDDGSKTFVTKILVIH